jgi:mevalonate kinase
VVAETHEAMQRTPKIVDVNFKALDFAVKRLEEATPQGDAEIATLIKACGSILEVQQLAQP